MRRRKARTSCFEQQVSKAMRSVPGALATGNNSGDLDSWLRRDPVATAHGTDLIM